MKKFLVTCAFPYANGSLHLGHILEHIQADIWVKHQKLIGNKVYFICADDAHGTPVMFKSKKLNISSKFMILNIYEEHKKDFINFNINHDIYCTTHNKLSYLLILKFMNNIYKKKLYSKYKVNQFYDFEKKIFLPDRYIKGKCPKCFAKNQYGDNCYVCGNIYSSLDLINPISLISNIKPEIYQSEHLFLKLNIFKKILYKWVISSDLQYEVGNQLLVWLKNDLSDWNISRDKPYFGFKIPNKFIKNKYFYVWLDALLSYISIFQYYCKFKEKKSGLFEDFWCMNNNNENKIFHFIGKDILYFHGLIWPTILHILNFKKPTKLIVHGHIIINGKKMSKSLNNFITVKNWLKYFDADSLRYYLSSKLSYKIHDINFCLEDFYKKINFEFVGKYINIASRISTFIEIYFDNYLSDKMFDNSFYLYFVDKSKLISDYFINFDFYKVLIEINLLLNIVNKYINNYEPWLKLKNKNKLHMFCTMIINIFKILSIYLVPIIPNISLKIEKFLKTKLIWENLNNPLLNHKISKYKNLYLKLNNSIKNRFLKNINNN